MFPPISERLAPLYQEPSGSTRLGWGGEGKKKRKKDTKDGQNKVWEGEKTKVSKI